MSPTDPIDPGPVRLKTVSLLARRHLMNWRQVGDPGRRAGLSAFVDALPDILAGRSLRQLLAALRRGRGSSRGLVWGLGAHVVKTGVSPYLIELMKHGFVTHLAVNGALVIHDFELAYCGETSEDVAESIRDGSFGMARETGDVLGALLSGPETARIGLGNSVGKAIAASDYPYRRLSLLAAAHDLGLPVTVHVALGTDVVHFHPACDWAAMGRGARRDFDLFVDSVARLDGGGVYLNVGSAVVLPEVFLKAVSVVRNLGTALGEFNTVVLDMLDQYRTRENVLCRPGGVGIRITGHHEILVPLIAGALLEEL
ncbi:MAG: hypothetical protein HY815_02225 [Candidatus Riflebacteria bacterium]|nr:hypothetical protein [Candidatus Riflebacteria bacterium]